MDLEEWRRSSCMSVEIRFNFLSTLFPLSVELLITSTNICTSAHRSHLCVVKEMFRVFTLDLELIERVSGESQERHTSGSSASIRANCGMDDVIRV
ncbi:hypothetical protein C0J45_22030 [Silurus meridionalis]|nr:hypothetical protein C0J45_22030 [Silurus meridionalis]